MPNTHIYAHQYAIMDAQLLRWAMMAANLLNVQLWEPHTVHTESNQKWLRLGTEIWLIYLFYKCFASVLSVLMQYVITWFVCLVFIKHIYWAACMTPIIILKSLHKILWITLNVFKIHFGNTIAILCLFLQNLYYYYENY